MSKTEREGFRPTGQRAKYTEGHPMWVLLFFFEHELSLITH